jgi:glycosyltransferase involved in cell wall biosynthesis
MPERVDLDLLLPFYGSPERLQEVVGSVLDQTSPYWRLVVVDDAWPGPGVEPWLTALADDRVVYHRNEVNLGVNGNFRRCLDLAEADLLAFPGGDDLLLPSYVDTVVRTARRTGAAMVQPGVRVIDDEGRTVRPLGDRVKALLAPRTGTTLAGEELARSLLRGNWAYFPSLCWRRDVTQRTGFTEGLETVLDLRLILELVLVGESLAPTPEVCFAYRRHAGSYSARTALNVDRFDEEADVFAWAAGACTRRGWPRAAAAARHRLTSRLHAASLLPAAVRSGETDAARRLARHALSRSR